MSIIYRIGFHEAARSAPIICEWSIACTLMTSVFLVLEADHLA